MRRACSFSEKNILSLSLSELSTHTWGAGGSALVRARCELEHGSRKEDIFGAQWAKSGHSSLSSQALRRTARIAAV